MWLNINNHNNIVIEHELWPPSGNRCCSLPRSGHRRARRFYQGGHGGGGSGSHGGPHVGTSGQGGAHSTPPPSPRQVCLVLPSSVHPAQIAALHSRSFRRRRSNSFSGLDAVRHSHRYVAWRRRNREEIMQ